MLSIPPDSKRLTLMRSGWAPGDLCARVIWLPAAGGGKAYRSPACPKPTRGGHVWRSEAAEGSVGMLSIPPDSKRLTLMRSGWALGDLCARVSV